MAEAQTAFESLVHPDDRSRVTELAQESLKTGQPAQDEWRILWPDGTTRWISGRWQAFTDDSRNLARVLGVNIDITHRKRVEEALAGVGRRLIKAQEQERARIGRELHDDINQQLSMLAVELEQLQDIPSEVRSGLQELRKHVTEISNDVHGIVPRVELLQTGIPRCSQGHEKLVR